MNILDNVTKSQKEAITHIDGPLLVIAGAGSGKTRVITRRIGYLVEQGTAPANILSITFTNKAANEMNERKMPWQNFIRKLDDWNLNKLTKKDKNGNP